MTDEETCLSGPHGQIDGWPDWQRHVRAALTEAAHHSMPLFMQDDDFAHWPLGERASVDSFEQWVMGGRQAQATLVALTWEPLVRLQPRWLRWRTTWAHRVRCLSLPGDQVNSLEGFQPCLVLKGQLLLRVVDPEHGRGLWTRDAAELQAFWHRGDAISQRSHDSGISTTLGL